MTDGDEDSLQRDLASLARLHVLETHARHRLVAQDLVHRGVPGELDFLVAARALLHDARGAQLVTAVDQRHLRGEASEEERFLECSVAAAHDRHGKSPEERAVAGGTGRNAAIHQALLAIDAEPLGRRAGGDHERVRGIGLAGGIHRERPLRHVELDGIFHQHLGAEALRLLLEQLHHVGPGHALRETRIVLDVRGQHQLPPELQASQKQWLELGPRGVDRRCVTGGTTADDDQPAVLRGTARGLLESQQCVELSAILERLEFVETTDVLLTDEDLRHRPQTVRPPQHLVALCGIRLDVDLGPLLPLRREQRLGAVAVRAPRLRIHHDVGHRGISRRGAEGTRSMPSLPSGFRAAR